MPIEFTNRGFLTPPKRHNLSIQELKNHFVDPFPKSNTRLIFFESYEKYTSEFKAEITPIIIQWIGGSFTSKKLNPRDIDMVTILSNEIYQKKYELIERKFRKDAKSTFSIDAYIVSSFGPEHPKFPLYQGNLVYWDNHFSKTRKNRAGKSFKRGYVQVIHQRFKP